MMYRTQILAAAIAVGCGLLVNTPAASQSAQPIAVGANVLVSRDGEFPHIEIIAAASPTDPNILIAAGTAYVPDGRAHDRAYVSTDRGVTWNAVVIPELTRHGSGDPMVTVSRSGALHFATLDFSIGAVSYRSADSGRTWQGPAKIYRALDHENFAVDLSRGRFGGRIYMSGEGGPGVQVFYSTDDGRSYSKGAVACQRKDWSNAAASLLTLSDGTLFVTCMPYPEGEARRNFREAEHGFTLSTDGGKTFAPFRLITKAPRLETVTARAAAQNLQLFAGNPNVSCAADTRTARFKDRIYCAWEQHDLDKLTSRIYLTYSSDKGTTWTTPRAIDTGVPAWATQIQQVVAVNRDGIVGVIWFDSRQSERRDRYDVYFTASQDGGATFLPPVRVSSASSFPAGPGNLRPSLLPPYVDTLSRVENHAALSPFAGRPSGGDYIGLTADAEGEFHPVWPDARSGTWQIYSARIRVAKPGESLAAGVPAADERAPATGKASVLFETATVDSANLEITIWGRIRNTSADTLYGPFSAELRGFMPKVMMDGLETQFPGEASKLWPSPTVVNASNGESGIGARFEYAGAAGTLDLLPPGAVTEARPWKFRVKYPRLAFIQLEADVRGFVRAPRAASGAR